MKGKYVKTYEAYKVRYSTEWDDYTLEKELIKRLSDDYNQFEYDNDKTEKVGTEVFSIYTIIKNPEDAIYILYDFCCHHEYDTGLESARGSLNIDAFIENLIFEYNLYLSKDELVKQALDIIEDLVLKALDKEPSIYKDIKGYAGYVADPNKLKEHSRSDKGGLWSLKTESLVDFSPSDSLNVLLNEVKQFLDKTKPKSSLYEYRFYEKQGVLWFIYWFRAKTKLDACILSNHDGVYDKIRNQLKKLLHSSEIVKRVDIKWKGRNFPTGLNSNYAGQHKAGDTAYSVECYIKDEYLPEIIDDLNADRRSHKTDLWGLKTFEKYVEETWASATWSKKVIEVFAKLMNMTVKELIELRANEDAPRNLTASDTNIRFFSPKTGYFYILTHQGLHSYNIEVSKRTLDTMNSEKIILEKIDNLVALDKIEELFNIYEDAYFNLQVKTLLEKWTEKHTFAYGGILFTDSSIKSARTYNVMEVITALKKLNNSLTINDDILIILRKAFLFTKESWLVKNNFVKFTFNDKFYQIVKNYCEENPTEYLEQSEQLKGILPEELIEELAYLKRGKRSNMWDMKMKENLMGYESDEERYNDEYDTYINISIEDVENFIHTEIANLVDEYNEEADNPFSDKMSLDGCIFADDLIMVYIDGLENNNAVEDMMDDFVDENIGFGFGKKEDGRDIFKMVYKDLLKKAKERIENIVKEEPIEAGKFADELEYYAKIKVPKDLKRAGKSGLLGYEIH